jgi:chromosomal replication initiator protein
VTVTEAYVDLATTIIARTAREYSVPVEAIVGRNRMPAIVTARAATAHRLWSETDLSLVQIGAVLGGRDHSSITYLVRRHELAGVAR